MNYIITIGREYGSGGRYIAEELAKRLNIEFYDKKIIDEVAEKAGLDVGYVTDHDEKKDSIFDFMSFNRFNVELTGAQRVSFAEFDVIRNLANKHSCVIVGRCADYVLKDNSNVINIFIHAPMEEKIKRVVSFYGVLQEQAEDKIKKMNKNRASYYNYYTDRKWGKAINYDLSVSSEIGIKETVDVIECYVKSKISSFK